MWRIVIVIPILLLAVDVASASTEAILRGIDRSRIENSTMQETIYDKLPQTEQELLAHVWGVSRKEYSHYLWLMRNTENGIYYADKNLDPTWILAINATSSSERKKYTIQAIKNERTRLAKLLAFQQEFNRLQYELYPNETPIALPNIKVNNRKPTILLQKNDIFLYFTALNNDLTNSLYQLIPLVQMKPGVRLNIYLVGNNLKDTEIQHWATQHHIPVELVKQGIITLNHDRGHFNKLTQGKVSLPFTVLNHDGQFQAVDLNMLGEKQ